jgi:hypothetical protein
MSVASTAVEVSRSYAPGTVRLATAKLVELLKDGEVGDVKTDEEMEVVCGKRTGVGENGYGYLQTALRVVLRDYGRLWKRTPGAGCIKCLTVQEGLEWSASRLRSACRASKRSVQGLQAMGQHASVDEMVHVNAMLAQHGTLAVLASSSQTKKLVSRKMSESVDPKKLLTALQESQKE